MQARLTPLVPWHNTENQPSQAGLLSRSRERMRCNTFKNAYLSLCTESPRSFKVHWPGTDRRHIEHWSSPSKDSPLTKPYNTTETAAYLAISRSTVRRLATQKLRPDGHTGSGRPFWHQQTLDAFRLGVSRKRNAIAFNVRGIPSISCDAAPDQNLLGRPVVLVSLAGPDQLQLLSEVYAAISQTQPVDLVIPARALDCPIGRAVIRTATESGCNVVLCATGTSACRL